MVISAIAISHPNSYTIGKRVRYNQALKAQGLEIPTDMAVAIKLEINRVGEC